MHSSDDAACKHTSLQTSNRANQFSFPPTQRFGLLDSTAFSSASRSADQRQNLQHSYEFLLEALHFSRLQDSPA